MRRPTGLILTARYGSGHLQVANTLAHKFIQKGVDVIVSDLFGESYPAISNITQSLLIKTFSYGPTFYKLFYYGTDKLNNKGLSQFSRYLGRKRLLELIAEHHPSFVISTFPLHSAPFVIKKSERFIPTYTVITDYCLHPYWINPLIDHYFVASEAVNTSLIKQNIPRNKITVSGIPTREEFELPIDKRTVYQTYQLSPFKRLITILAGADGVLKNVKQLCQFLLSNPDYQIFIICGNNDNLYEKLRPLTVQFPRTFRLMGYVDKIHEIFAVSDCLITKPGGVTLSEALALQVPLILHQPVPGQERENARYFEQKGAALVSNSALTTFEHVQLLTQNKDLARKLRKELKLIYTQHSSTIITDHVIKKLNQSAFNIR